MQSAAARVAMIATLACFGSVAGAQDRVVARVDGDAILLSELDAAVAPYPTRLGPTAPAPVRAQVLDQLIEGMLIEHAAAHDGIVVSDADVDAAIDDVREIGATGPPAPHDAAYRADVRRMLLRFRVVNARLASRVTVSEAEVRARYDELVARHPVDAPSYESVRAAIRAQMRQEAMQRQETALMEELRRQATIQRMLDEE